MRKKSVEDDCDLEQPLDLKLVPFLNVTDACNAYFFSTRGSWTQVWDYLAD